MNSKKKPAIKPVSTKQKSLTDKVKRPSSLPEEHYDKTLEVRRDDAPGDNIEAGKKSRTLGKTSDSARPAPQHPPIMPDSTQAEYFKDIVGTIREPLVVLDADLRVLAANRSFYKFFKVKAGETIGQLIYNLGDRQWDIPGLRLLLETIPPQKATFNDYMVEHDFPVIGRRILLLNARRISRLPNKASWILLAFEDITERMELERKLQASEERFRRAFETAQDGMLLIEKARGQIVNSNRSAEDMLGYSKRSLRTKNLWELGILKDEGQFRQTALELEQQGFVGLADRMVPTRQGGHFPADVYLTDRAAVIQCNIRDVSERKQAEEALQDSEHKASEVLEFNQKILNTSSIGIISYKESGQCVSANAAAVRIIGGTMAELLAQNFHEILSWKQSGMYQAAIQALDTGVEQLLEAHLLTTFGKDIWISFSFMLFDSAGKRHLLVLMSDITERKLAEEALIYERNLLNALMDNIPDHIYFKDSDSRFIRMNRAQAEGFGISNPVQAMGKTDFDFFTEQHARPAFENEQEIIKTGRPMVNFEETETYRDGRVATVSTTKVPFRNPDGQIIGTIGISRDITERKQAESKLEEYSEHLEEMVDERTRELRQARDKLVRKEKLAVLGQLAGSVGHELRNPLGVISNSVYYLKMVQPDVNEKIKKYHDMIEQEVHNAAQIVSDLLDYAREISTDPKPGSVTELVEHTLSRFPVPTSIQVSLKIPADLPQVYTDPLHVEQILGNLITNACQAMSPPSLNQSTSSVNLSGGGKLTITARRQEQMVAIAVKDTGTGIIPENKEKLFEPLFSTKINGIGLGLAVSKKLAEANGGGIEVESEAGKGSTFTLYLPVFEGS